MAATAPTRRKSRKPAPASGPAKSRPARPHPAAPAAPPARPAAPDTVSQLDALWSVYLSTRARTHFDALVAAYRPYVESVARRFAKRLPPSVDLDDLVSAGCFGLMDAINAFDPAHGAKFQTFGLKRIAGAMNDHLRAQDIAPRLARRREALVKRAQDDFRKAHGRSPTEEELLRLIHADAEQARAIVSGSEIPAVASLTTPSAGDEGLQSLECLLARTARHGETPGPEARGLGGTFDRDIQRWLGRSLSRSERLIIWLYYFEGLTMKEIGQSLGICEGRVSQIHALLLERLRARLTREEDLA